MRFFTIQSWWWAMCCIFWYAAAEAIEPADRARYDDRGILPKKSDPGLALVKEVQPLHSKTKDQQTTEFKRLNHLPIEIVFQFVRQLALPEILKLFNSDTLSPGYIRGLRTLMLGEARTVVSYLVGFPIETEDQAYSAVKALTRTCFYDLQPFIAPIYRTNLGSIAHTLNQFKHFTAGQAEIAAAFGLGGQLPKDELQRMQSLISELEVGDYPFSELVGPRLQTLAPLVFHYTTGYPEVAFSAWTQLLAQPASEYVISANQLMAWFAPQWAQELTLLHKHYAFRLQTKHDLLTSLFDGLVSAALLQGDMEFVFRVYDEYKPYARHFPLGWHPLTKAVLVGAQNNYQGTDALAKQLSTFQLQSACGCAAAYQLLNATTNLNAAMGGACSLSRTNVATCNLYLNLPLGYSPDQTLAKVLTMKLLKSDYIRA